MFSRLIHAFPIEKILNNNTFTRRPISSVYDIQDVLQEKSKDKIPSMDVQFINFHSTNNNNNSIKFDRFSGNYQKDIKNKYNKKSN